MPFDSASTKTATIGTTTNKARKPSVTRDQRAPQPGTVTQRDRLRADDLRAVTCAPRLAAVPADPGLQPVDDQQHDERRHQHHQRQRRGARIVELLQLGDDQQRHDLRLHRHVAGDEDDRSVFADGARERQRQAGQRRCRDRGQDHPRTRSAAASRPASPRPPPSGRRSPATPAARCARRTASPRRSSRRPRPAGANATFNPSGSMKRPSQPFSA